MPTIEEILANPTMLLIVGIALVLFIMGLTGAGKTKKMGRTFLWLGGIGLVLFLVAPLAGFDLFGGFAPLAITTTTEDAEASAVDPSAALCPPGSVEDVTVTLSAVDSETDVATGGTHRYRVNSNPAQTVADAGTFTASGGDTITVMFENATQTVSYFSSVKTVQLDCNRGTQTISDRLGQNGTFTINLFNEEGNLLDGTAENETLAAGDTVDLKFEIRGQNKRAFPYGGILTIELNKSEFDESETEIEFTSLGGKLASTSTPEVHSLTDTGNLALSFELPVISGSTLHTGTLHLDADDDTNPQWAADPVITFRPNNYFVDDDNQGAFAGPAVEDEDNVATYQHVTTATVHID